MVNATLYSHGICTNRRRDALAICLWILCSSLNTADVLYSLRLDIRFFAVVRITCSIYLNFADLSIHALIR